MANFYKTIQFSQEEETGGVPIGFFHVRGNNDAFYNRFAHLSVPLGVMQQSHYYKCGVTKAAAEAEDKQVPDDLFDKLMESVAKQTHKKTKSTKKRRRS